MTAATAAQTVAFVLVSYRPDEPAGIERSVAATTAGLRALGHRALILTAAPQPCPDPDVIRLTQLQVTFPCHDQALRQAIRATSTSLAREISAILHRHQADVVTYTDALWGLGRLAGQVSHPAVPVLAVHVTGHRADLAPAIKHARRVIAPSPAVLAEASRCGYDTASWAVVPNPLLVDPADIAVAGPAQREHLRLHGPVRAVARLGPEKGVTSLLQATPPSARTLQLVLAQASFEASSGSQHALLARCQDLAKRAGAELRPALPWAAVPEFLAGAALTIIPSRRETFGCLALESLSAGTPVAAYATGNLPALIGPAGILVPPAAGPKGLWRAASQLLADPVTYRQACGAAYCRCRNYRSADVAGMLLKAVRS
jgi:glycosyltransferase involved in cell wall biosynthesis